MKKQLLVGAMLMGALFTANAQFSTSFEASEGYEMGDIYDQEGWTSTVDEDLGAPIAGTEVSDAYASDGEYSLSVTADENYATLNGVGFGAISPTFSADFSEMVASADIYIDEDDDAGTDGANFAIQLQGGEGEEGLIVSRFEFAYDHSIALVDMVDGEPAYVGLDMEWEPNTWYQVDMIYDFGDGTINYYLNGELVHEGSVWAGEVVDTFVVLHDNWPGNVAYVDGVSVTEGTTAGVDEVLASKFSVFPNPANDVITIANAENLLVNGVSIADINGRTVKSAQFAGVTNATVNVSDLASGVYMMTVASDKGTVTKKIVKN